MGGADAGAGAGVADCAGAGGRVGWDGGWGCGYLAGDYVVGWVGSGVTFLF